MDTETGVTGQKNYMCVTLSRDGNGRGGSEMDVLNYFSGAGHGMPEESQPANEK